MTKTKLALAATALVLAVGAAVLAFGTAPGSAKTNAAFKAAWIYVGPHNDGGWSQAHDQGRLYVQTALGVEGPDDLQGDRPGRSADVAR